MIAVVGVLGGLTLIMGIVGIVSGKRNKDETMLWLGGIAAVAGILILFLAIAVMWILNTGTDIYAR